MQEKKRSTYSGIDDDDEENEASPTLSRKKRDNLEGQRTLITTTTTTGKTNEYNMFCNRRPASLCQYKRRLFTQLDGELGDWQRNDVEKDRSEKAGRREKEERERTRRRGKTGDKAMQSVRCNNVNTDGAADKKIWRKNNLMTVRHTSSCFSSICMRVPTGLFSFMVPFYSPSLPLSSLDVRTILSPQNVFDLSPVAIDATSFFYADIDFPL